MISTRLATPLLAILLVTSACSASTPAEPDASASPAAAPSFAVPSHSPAAVAPATGRRHRLVPVSLVLPDGFAQTSDLGNDSVRLLQFAATDPVGYVELTRTGQVSSTDLDDAAKQAATNSPIRPTRLDDRTVGGQPVYALSGANEYTALYYAVGRVVDGALVEISFSFQVDAPANDRLIEAVLASVEWSS